MNRSRIITSLFLVCLLIFLLKLFGPLKGSETNDFSKDLKPDDNPLRPCPDSPNCIRLSAPFNIESLALFDILPKVLTEMNAEKIVTDSQTLQTDAVFRIPIFGFRDDVSASIEPDKVNNRSVLHLSSRSRLGRGDLGVNRRRVKRFLRILNNFLY